MAIRRGSRSVSTLNGGDLAIDITHTQDSVQIGDGTDLLDFEDVGGVKSIPVKVRNTTTDAVLTGGTQRSKITDGTDNVEIDDVGGEKALKVSVISSIGGGAAPAETDKSSFIAGSSVFTPIGGEYDADGSADLADGETGMARVTAERAIHVHVASQAAGAGGLTDTELRASPVPVSVSGVSTAAKQDTIIGHVDGIEGLLTTMDADTSNISTKIDTLAGAVSGLEMQVDIVSSALPTGAATSANQTTIIGHLDGVEGLLTTIDADTSAMVTSLQLLDNAISGNELQVDIVTSALPSGASTSAKQDTMITSLQLIDDVIFTDDAAFTPATSKVLVIGATADDTATDSVDEGDVGALRMTPSRHLMVAVQSSTLPTGASTLAEQQSQTTHLSNIATSVGVLDNAISGSEMQVDVVTLPAIPAGTNVIGKVSIVDAAGDSCMDGTNDALRVNIVAGAGSGGTAMTDDGAFTAGSTSITPVGGVYQATPDSVDDGDAGALRMSADRILLVDVDSSALPTGASTSAKQDTMIGHLDGVEGLLTTIDADTSNISTKIDQIDADTSALAACASGSELQVDIVSSALPSGAATSANQSTMITSLQLLDDVVFTDDAAFTPATSKGFAIGAQCDDTSTDSVDEGDFGVLRMKADRSLHINVNGITSGVAIPITDNGGNISIDDGGNTITVDGTVAATQSGTWNVGTVTTVSTVTAVTDITNNVKVVGPAAHDAGVSGAPVRVGGRAMLANGTAVAEDDTADIATDNQGRVVVTPHVPRDLVVQATGTQANTTEATMLAAGAAGVFHDITKLILTNSNTTTQAQVQIRDDTGGSIVLELILAPNGGAVLDFGTVPMKQTTAAKNWTIDLQASVSTVYYFVQAIKRIA